MQFLLPLVIGLVVGGVIGALIVLVLRGRRPVDAPGDDPAVVEARHQTAIAQLQADADRAAAQQRAEADRVLGEVREQLATATATAEALREQAEGLRERQRELLEQQRSEEAERRLREQQESKVLQALAPVRETLKTMHEKVSDLEKQRSEQYGSLAEQLKQAQLSDEQLRSTTESLASALRSNSTRGVWGETQLRRVVEAAGLTQYIDFDVQQTIHTDAGAGRPDMVIKLPGAKSIAVDSKVPLEHYIQASQIPVTASGDEAARRKGLIDQHVRAVRGHVDALAKKSYWEGLDASPEFVIAFIPSEALLSSALEADPALLDYSFGKRVALASPVNLWAVLKTVAFTWQQQAVTDEAKKLFDLGNTLYQRIGVLSGHADSLRKAIERTVDSYNKFANSLESRVLVTARQFPGIDQSKISVVQQAELIHEQPRHIAALELTEAAGEPTAAEEGVFDATEPEGRAEDADEAEILTVELVDEND